MPDAAIDHVLLGCADLEQGVAFVERAAGVRPAYGGVHPGRGTRNAVLSLGDRTYLEVIAPDPQQALVEPWLTSRLPEISALPAPQLVGWAVRPADIDALVTRLRRSGTAIDGPHPGTRTRADGRVLRWRMARLADDAGGILPFFMQWEAGSPHPGDNAETGCVLERFALSTPDAHEAASILALAGLEIPFEGGEAARLHAVIAGPRGRFEL